MEVKVAAGPNSEQMRAAAVAAARERGLLDPNGNILSRPYGSSNGAGSAERVQHPQS